jgi:hypothetical protein
VTTATNNHSASVQSNDLVITHDPESAYYAVLRGSPGSRVADFYLRLIDAVRWADPTGDRIWEDPAEVTDRELDRNTILFSRRTKDSRATPLAP